MNILNTSGYELYNPSVIKANNCTLTDVSGKLYYDFEAGVWALPLGHNHPRINKVIINQLSKVSHVGYRYNDPVAEKAAEALLRIMNMERGKCLFLSSGSEAVEFAVKAVLKLTNKPYLLKLDRHYLSAYGLSGDMNSERMLALDWQPYYGRELIKLGKRKTEKDNNSVSAGEAVKVYGSDIAREAAQKGSVNSVREEILKNEVFSSRDAVTGTAVTSTGVRIETSDTYVDEIALTKDTNLEILIGTEDSYTLAMNEEDIDYSELLATIPFDRIGAFLFEPGNASGTAKLPPKKLIEGIVTKIKSQGGYLVVDEVTTGMGRTGKWFAFEHYRVKPDIIACGKGLGNGYPVSAIGFRREVAELLEKSDLIYGQSHQNDPLGCAIAKEVIATIREETLLKKATELGEYFKTELKKLMTKHNCIKEIRGVGLMITMEMEEELNTMVGKSTLLSYLHQQLYASGFIVGIKPAANLLRFYPPLTIEKYMIDDLIFNLEHILPYSAEIG